MFTPYYGHWTPRNPSPNQISDKVIIPMRAHFDAAKLFIKHNPNGEQKYPLGTVVYNKRAAGTPVKRWVAKWNSPGGEGPWNTYWLQDDVGEGAVCHPTDRDVKEEDIGLWEEEWDAVIQNPGDWDRKFYIKIKQLSIRQISPREVAFAAERLAWRMSDKVRR